MDTDNLTSPEVIQHVVPPRAGFALWLYHRFNLSSRNIEDLMGERHGWRKTIEPYETERRPECRVDLTSETREFSVASRNVIWHDIRCNCSTYHNDA